MRIMTLAIRALVALATLAVLTVSVFAQQPAAKPYHDGPVWDISYIRVKAGMDDRYLRYIADSWKREQEAMKKAGYSLDYKVIVTEPHGPQDFNVILMTQYKDRASMEANRDKAEALMLQLEGGQQKLESGYQDRASYREVLGTRQGREIILTPKGASEMK